MPLKEKTYRKPITVFRLVEINRHGQQQTLFHGYNLKGRRLRTLPEGEWLRAENKQVTDGGTWYESGWHVVPDYLEAEAYLKRFKKPRCLEIIPVLIRGRLRRKAHSNAEVYLADWMMICESNRDDPGDIRV